jgi:hypothetical protein
MMHNGLPRAQDMYPHGILLKLFQRLDYVDHFEPYGVHPHDHRFIHHGLRQELVPAKKTLKMSPLI